MGRWQSWGLGRVHAIMTELSCNHNGAFLIQKNLTMPKSHAIQSFGLGPSFEVGPAVFVLTLWVELT